MKKFVSIALLLLLLAGCGTEEAESTGTGNSAEPIKVEFNVAAQSEVAETVVLAVTVTQGDEVVDDADEVVFEVWKSGHRSKGEMITAEHKGDGMYQAETFFDEEGLYFIQAHTTARRLHVMPKHELTVGNPDPASIVPDDSEAPEDMSGMDEHSGH